MPIIIESRLIYTNTIMATHITLHSTFNPPATWTFNNSNCSTHGIIMQKTIYGAIHDTVVGAAGAVGHDYMER